MLVSVRVHQVLVLLLLVSLVHHPQDSRHHLDLEEGSLVHPLRASRDGKELVMGGLGERKRGIDERM
jgi:hypothetical protein